MRYGRQVLGTLVVVLLFLSLYNIASAHANLLRSDPGANSVLQTAPKQLRLWFTEPLEEGFSKVQVYDMARRRVDRGDSRVLPEDSTAMVVSLQALEEGTYTVAWTALSSVDGHVTRGNFSISIGSASTAPAASAPQEAGPLMPIEAIVRWSGYLAATALVGSALFQLLVLGPVSKRQNIATAVSPAVAPRLRRLARWSWLALATTSCAALALQTLVLGETRLDVGFSSVAGQLLFTTRYGVVWLLRLLLLMAAGATLWWIGRQERPLAWWFLVGLGAPILLTTSLNSHSAAVAGQAKLAVIADWLHLLSVACWVGGLLGLAFVLPRGLSALQPAQRRQLLAGIAARFSTVAALSVILLLTTGIFQAWLHVGSLPALVETAYGKSLLVKLGLVGLLLAIGAVNLLVIRPRLARVSTDAGDSASAARTGRTFARAVGVEAALAILVLLVTGVLTSLAPGRQTYEQLQATQPLLMTTQVQNLLVDLSISPARPGHNSFVVTVRDEDGQPITDAERVSLDLRYLDQELGTNVAIAQHQEAGRYTLQSTALSLAGRWQAELLIRRPGQDDLRTAFRFSLTATAAAELRPNVATGGWPELNLSELLALAITLAGLVLLLYVARSRTLRVIARRRLLVGSLLTVGCGLILSVLLQARATPAQFTINPFFPTEQSLATGERIYRQRCQVCHGTSGRGDGPAAAGLSPKPADLRKHMAAGHTDSEIFSWIANGVEGTAMPAFRDQLSEEEIWHVINFVREFASQP